MSELNIENFSLEDIDDNFLFEQSGGGSIPQIPSQTVTDKDKLSVNGGESEAEVDDLNLLEANNDFEANNSEQDYNSIETDKKQRRNEGVSRI